MKRIQDSAVLSEFSYAYNYKKSDLPQSAAFKYLDKELSFPYRYNKKKILFLIS